MVGVLVRLKRSLLLRYLRDKPVRIVGLALGGLFGLLFVVVSAAGMVTVGLSDDVALARSATVGLTSTILLGWIVMPLLAFGSDATLDPARFALLPLSARRLRPGLLVAGLISVPGLLSALALLGTALAWFGYGVVPAVLGVLMAVLSIGTAFLLARTLTTAFASALSSRRFKDVGAVLLAIVAATFGIGMNRLSTGASENPDQAEEAMRTGGQLLGWTPLGWAAAVPGDAAAGHWVAAALRLVLALALVGVLWTAWGRLLERSLTHVSESDGGDVRAGSGRIERLYGTGPTGAVAGRCLRYWRRDPRYLASVVSMAILPVILAVSIAGSGGGTALLGVPVLMALMSGPSLTSDLAYDHSALWTHVVTGVPGRADRLGRALALGTVQFPMVLVSLLAVMLLSGRWDLLLGVLAACVAAGLAGLAVGLLLGAVEPGKAPAPGESPFGSSAGGGVVTILIYLGSILGAALLALPICLPLLLLPSTVLIQGLFLLLALVWGAGLLTLSVRLAGRRLDTHWPELFGMVRADTA